MILDRGLDNEMQRGRSCRAGDQCPTLHVNRAKVSRTVISKEECAKMGKLRHYKQEIRQNMQVGLEKEVVKAGKSRRASSSKRWIRG